MSGWDESAITITTLLPVAGALVIIMVPKEKDRLVRALGILFTGVALALAEAIAAFVGVHPKFTQEPPRFLRSASATLFPAFASACARGMPAWPPPMIRMS